MKKELIFGWIPIDLNYKTVFFIIKTDKETNLNYKILFKIKTDKETDQGLDPNRFKL